VRTGTSVLQSSMQHLCAAGGSLFSGRLQLGFGAGEHAVRHDHVQHRLRVLQLELQHLRALRRDVRQKGLRQFPRVSDRPALRHEHLQHGLRMLQSELRHLRASRRNLLERALHLSSRSRLARRMQVLG
jgi:hypothetical protein